MAKTNSNKSVSGKTEKSLQIQTPQHSMLSVSPHHVPFIDPFKGDVADIGADSWLEVFYKGAVQYKTWKNEQEERERERAVSEREAYIENRSKRVERSNVLLKQANEHLKNCQKSLIIISPEEYVNAVIPGPVIPDKEDIYNRHCISPVSAAPLFGKRKAEFEKAKALAESEYSSENAQYVKDQANSKRERQKLLNEIASGSVGAYSRYLTYALEKNVKHALDGYDTEFTVQSSAHFMRRSGKVQANIMFPTFEEFRLLKTLEYDAENDQVNRIYEDDDKIRRETYKDFIKSLTLLITAAIFECDSWYGFVNTVHTIGSRGFLEEATGMEFYYGLCDLSMSADTYSGLYVKDLSLRSFYDAKGLDFNATFFEDAFFIDTVKKYDEMKKNKKTEKAEELPPT